MRKQNQQHTNHQQRRTLSPIWGKYFPIQPLSYRELNQEDCSSRWELFHRGRTQIPMSRNGRESSHYKSCFEYWNRRPADFKPSMQHHTPSKAECFCLITSWKVRIISMLGILMAASGSAFRTSIRIRRPKRRYILTGVPVIPKMICNTMMEPLVLIHARQSPRQTTPDSILGLPP